jgi:hypothetical protein
MKKIIVTGVLVLSSLGFLIAYAATNSEFTDKGQFADWFAPSVQKMQFNNIMTGYEDGSFKSTSNVTRSELAVIMDRFATVMGKPLNSEPLACTMLYAYGLNLHIYDQNGQPVTDATVSVNTAAALSDKNFTQQDGVYVGLGEAPAGYYTITITKTGYATYYETIKMEHDDCHVMPQTRTITLAAQK